MASIGPVGLDRLLGPPADDNPESNVTVGMWRDEFNAPTPSSSSIPPSRTRRSSKALDAGAVILFFGIFFMIVGFMVQQYEADYESNPLSGGADFGPSSNFFFSLGVIGVVVGSMVIAVAIAKGQPETVSVPLEPPTPAPAQPQIIQVKETVREIVKVRCDYCGSLNLETDDKCKYCGGNL